MAERRRGTPLKNFIRAPLGRRTRKAEHRVATLRAAGWKKKDFARALGRCLAWNRRITAMTLAIYSKYQTVEDIRKALKQAPRQEANSKEAIEGKVFELCDKPLGPVTTLSEVFEYRKALSEVFEYRKETLVLISARDGNITVRRAKDGTWAPYGIGEDAVIDDHAA